jgi:hypothetical protein
MLKTTLILALALAAGAAHAEDAKRASGWTTLAGCAAAYRAKANLADKSHSPDAPALAQKSKDYIAAAQTAYQSAGTSSTTGAEQAVRSYAIPRARLFAAKPHGEMEDFIKTCPPLG